MEQREIKFKAWHNELKVMLHPPSGGKSVILCEDSNGNGIKTNIDGKDEPIPAHMTWEGVCYAKGRRQNVIWLQYAGLKEKNGKEIYEGDFLRDKNERIWLIRWEEIFAGFVIELQEKRKTYDLRGNLRVRLEKYQIDGMEVIGNIYENSELLKA